MKKYYHGFRHFIFPYFHLGGIYLGITFPIMLWVIQTARPMLPCSQSAVVYSRLKNGISQINLYPYLLCVLTLFWQMNYTQTMSVRRWRERVSVTITKAQITLNE